MSAPIPTGRSSYRTLAALTLSAIGVVYGDIGTSPLYALRECFYGPHAFPISPENVLGVLSLLVWSLLIVVSFKYLMFVMRADNRGEGGILALLSLLRSSERVNGRWASKLVLLIGIFGAALLYGDGAITPAISVLSAVEGLEVATPFFSPFVLPLTLIILVLLFSAQRNGTARLGLIFGPVIVVWFLVLACLGLRGIFMAPEVLSAFHPYHAIDFFLRHQMAGIVVLGAVFLVITGSEALYADMGHFGPRPIRLGWFILVLPALLLNYLGQGALILTDPGSVSHPFYELAPQWALYPLVALSTLATVIASQALISGAFSITAQAIQFGYLPRMQVLHTSSRSIGQIYVPTVNILLFVAAVFLVLGFKTSSNLAAAYGIAVALTMFLTTLLLSVLIMRVWRWRAWYGVPLIVVFLSIDIAFLLGNAPKIPDGGWVPLVFALGLFTLMTTWLRGREILAERLTERALPFDAFLERLNQISPTRVPGTAVFMARNIDSTPTALIQNTLHNKVLHDRVILLQVTTTEEPYVAPPSRCRVEPLYNGFERMFLHYGFMETPNVPAEIERAADRPLDLDTVTFFLGREIILATHRPGMALWRERLFAFLTQLALRATAFYQIPSEQVIEIGTQVEM